MMKADPGQRRHDERWLREKVILLCADRDYLWHYCADSRRCDGMAGFPDLIIIGKRGCIFAELKVDTFRHKRASQVTWGHSLLAAGIFYVTWYVRDLESGSIERSLDELR
jgi:hypothetical protein